MIQIQATFTGFKGRPCTLFSMYEQETGVLYVVAEDDYHKVRRDGYIVLTNVPDIDRDTLFIDANLRDAIVAFYSLKVGVAADGKSSRLVFAARAGRANPESSIERDGIDANGPKYRVDQDITCAQMAALATCLYASRASTIDRTVEMAEALRRLLAGEIVTI